MATHCLISKTENCKNCYKCIRSCPIKAISFENNRATIIHEECILCGTCYNICPQQLKEVRNDVNMVKGLLKWNKVIASVAPSHVAYYENTDISAIRDALLQLGFSAVEETAIGATIVKKAYDEMINDGRDVVISSCCHSINLLIEKRYPECLPYLADVLTPMQAHGLNIRERYGDEIKVVFIGPCTAKKEEFSPYGSEYLYVDSVLTFEELKAIIDSRDIDMDSLEPDESFSEASYYGRVFARSGGLVEAVRQGLKELDQDFDLKAVSCNGIEECRNVLTRVMAGTLDVNFIEGMACVGGCVGGAGCITRSPANRVFVDRFGKESSKKTLKQP